MRLLGEDSCFLRLEAIASRLEAIAISFIAFQPSFGRNPEALGPRSAPSLSSPPVWAVGPGRKEVGA